MVIGGMDAPGSRYSGEMARSVGLTIATLKISNAHKTGTA